MRGNSSHGNREVLFPPAADGAAGRAGKGASPKPATNGSGKSDRLVVPKNSPNKAGSSVAEAGEGRSLAKENTDEQNAPRTQCRKSAPSALDRVREAARRNKEARFTALFHHLTPGRLLRAFWRLEKKAAAGVDGVTWRQYREQHLEKIHELHQRLQRGAYRAKPSRRVYIPKADGRRRALGIAALEDKIVQSAFVEVLNAVYENDFCGFSYGFRPGRSQHDALDALATGLARRKVNWVLDADIRGFFDAIDHEWLMKFFEHRIADKRMGRLVKKWLAAGVLEDGKRTDSEMGTPQGATVSPLLANLYLHYVLDLWVLQWRKRRARGDVMVVRYADDFIVGFQHRSDAERFLGELRERMRQFALELHPEKTRLLEFGRYAAENRRKRGQGKPETFNFLGFTHICGRARKGGYFVLNRQTIAKRLRAALQETKTELRRRMHQPVREQGKWLGSVVRGYFAYHAVPTNNRALSSYRFEILRMWKHALRRRGQRDRTDWNLMTKLGDRWLPKPRIQHPWPTKRFDATHPRQEPGARNALAGIRAGGDS